MHIFVVPGNGQALLAMPYKETLDVLTINCNTVNTQTQSSDNNSKIENELHYTNNTQERGKPDKYNINTTGFLNSNKGGKTIIIDNIYSKLNYFIPGPLQEADERASAEIMQQIYRKFKDVFTWIEHFNGTFSLQTKLDSNPYQNP